METAPVYSMSLEYGVGINLIRSLEETLNLSVKDIRLTDETGYEEHNLKHFNIL